jgi:hypothetical protein
VTAGRRVADAIESIAVTLLHPTERARHAEEWQADLDGAAETGIPPVSLALGALRFGIDARLAEPRRLGISPAERAVRLTRWALLPLLVAPLFALVAWTSGALLFLPWELLLAAVVVLWLAGIALLGTAVRVAGHSLWWLSLAALPAVPVLVPLSGLLVAPVLLVGTGVALAFFVAWANRVAGVPVAPPASLRRRLGAAAIACSLILGTIAAGLADGLVWMPLAITDDSYGLADIYGVIGLAVAVPLVVWAAIGLALALALVAITATPGEALTRALSPKRIVLLGFVLAGLGLLAAPWGAFALGMEISDTIPPMVGGGSVVTPFLSVGGGLALLVALLGTLPPGRVRRPELVAQG